METQRLLIFFTRPERSLLGVCSVLSRKFNQPAVAFRIAFIVLTILVIPVGIILYVGVKLVARQRKSKALVFGFLGAVSGIPLSYYFQPAAIRNHPFLEAGSVVSYLRNFTKAVEQYDRFGGNGPDIIYNVLLSMVVFTAIGAAAGYFMDRREAGN